MNVEKVRTLKIAWDKNMPAEVKDALLPIVDDWAHLVPTWCHFLKILYNIEAELIMSTTA